MKPEKRQSVAPYYAVAAVWLLAGLTLPMYRLTHYAVLALLSLGVFLAVRAITASAKPIGEEA